MGVLAPHLALDFTTTGRVEIKSSMKQQKTYEAKAEGNNSNEPPKYKS
jgi:hypothetical protein